MSGVDPSDFSDLQTLVKQKLIKNLGDLKSYIHKKYYDDKEAGKVKDNWFEKGLKDYDPEAKEVVPIIKLPSI